MKISRTIGLLLAVAMVLSVAAAVHAQASNGWEFSGYSQFRFESKDSDIHAANDATDEFDVRRARIKAEGPVSDNTTFRIQYGIADTDDSGSDGIDLKDLYLKRPFGPEWVGRIGFGNMEFGLDVPYSSKSRLPFERSEIVDKLLDGERTTGAFFFYEPSEDGNTPMVTLGLSEDMATYHGDAAGDIKEALALSVRAEWPLDKEGSMVGVSFLTSDADYWMGQNQTLDVENYTDDVWGAHIRYEGVKGLSGLNFQAEYVDGSRADTDSNGWYGTLEYTPAQSQGTVFYRYDTAETDGVAGEWEANTLGYAYDLDASQRITAQAKDIDTMSGATGTDYGIQWQIRY